MTDEILAMQAELRSLRAENAELRSLRAENAELRSLRAENAELRDRLLELKRGATFDHARVDTELERLKAIARASGHFRDL